MTRIDPADRLAAVIRSQVSALRRSPRPDAGKKAPGKSRMTQDFASLVAQRAGVIDAGDPQRHRKVFKIFLESVLIAELGEELLNDPAFHAMVEHIQQQMENDADLASSMQAAAATLLSEKRGRTG